MLTEILCTILAILFLWKALKKPSNYPPGPWGLPLIGYLPLRQGIGEEFLLSLNKEYGDVVSWRVGTQMIVFLYDFQLNKEAFQGPDFVDKPNIKLFQFLNGNKSSGIISSNGQHWSNIRRFTIRHLNSLGMGKSSFSSVVQYEATEFVNELKKDVGKPTQISSSLATSIMNVLWQMIAGKRYSFEDERILEFNHLIFSMIKTMGNMVIPDIFPWTKYVIPQSIKRKLFKEDLRETLTNKLRAFLKESISEHAESLDSQNPRDYIDEYLIEMEKQKDDPTSTMSMEDLIFCLSDIFGAGVEASTSTVQWCILYMASNPQVQAKLQKEIDSAVPKGVSVSLEDKAELPYLDAFIHEVLRHSSSAVFSSTHVASKDVIFNGYFIPKDTLLFGVATTAHFDPAYHDSPHDFRPERFIKNGKFENPSGGFLPFGIGKRQCLAESLARMEIFIFLTTMIQNVNFAVPEGKTLDMNPIQGNPIVRLPDDSQDIIITLR